MTHYSPVQGFASRLLLGFALSGVAFYATPPHATAQTPYPAASQAQRQFQLQHRDADDLLPQLKSILGGGAEILAASGGKAIVVRGDESAIALAQQVLGKLDRAPAGGPPEFHSYNVPQEMQAAVQQWQQQFRGAVGERAAWDPRTGQLIVLASQSTHQNVKAMLTAGQPAGPASVRLSGLTPDALHARIQDLVNQPLPATWDASRTWLSFPIRLGSTGGVNLQVNSSTGEVLLSGQPQQVAAWTRVIQAMDARGAGGGVEVVASEGARLPAVRRALSAIEQSSGQRPIPGQFAAAQVTDDQRDESFDEQETPLPGRATREQAETLRAVVESQQAGALLGPVQVEFIEGLDIIVLRGNDQDVQRVLQIIDQIERLSEVTVPAIEVLALEHVDGESMTRLLNRVYQQVLGPRTGGVSVTTLGKPNELLLIGRAENVKMAIDLVKRLDKPADPTSQFVVFQLKNAAANDAKTLVDQYLGAEEQQNNQATDDTGALLDPKALVIADSRSNSLIVRAAPRDMKEIAALLERIDTSEVASVDEVRVFKLRNARADELATILQESIAGAQAATGEDATGRAAGLRFVTIDADTQQRLDSGILTNVRVAPDVRANSLIITAPADSMPLIAALIRQLDGTPDAEAELKVFTIKNGDAEALVEMLRSLFTTEDDDPASGGLKAGTSSLVPLQFSVDARTNSIIAAGSADDLAIVEAVLIRLDGSDDRARRIEVYRLNNAPAEDVASAINDWLQNKRDIEEAAELPAGPFEQIDREVIVVPELVSNSLIISATDEYFTKLEELIRKLDERPPMVMIQVLIAEVKLNDTDEFGVELGLQDSLLFDRSLVGEINSITNTTQTTTGGGATTITETDQIVLNAPLTPGFNFNDVQNPLGNNGSTSALATAGKVAAQSLSSFGVGRVNSELGFGGFVFSASSNSVNMLLRALQENRRLEVLSRPQIMALDNQQGTVSVGSRVPTIQGVSFTEFGQQQNQITYEDVGIILEVTPRISPDNQVVMQVYAEKSQLGPEAEGIPVFAAPGGAVVRAPVINQTVARTVVTAGTGQTVVLSGLLTKQTSDVHRRVPLLSDIPLLGDLFRYDGVSQQRTELLIIMTPRIVRNEVDADMIKQVESARMSWVMCDVVNMHGPSGLKGRTDDWNSWETQEVYPTEVPCDENGAPIYQEGPVQPAPYDLGSHTEPTADTNITPAGFTPGGGPGVETAVGHAPARRLPPVK
ncbi:putative type II secretion system protein D precursor [Posidoniimonas polymericola]|uniref:Putative type II secretion system protein D n=1 Tax=Posidoniimonas polymericola TaxID=2528002 RepID=A0A5C5XVT1_9BACT|nr:secretin N-terminal domain-containing protein [Posidoniimonas polymericola]TWT67014.1 putative type II secretion system protein D precursor [Posidoniimonas polymericola]